MKALKPICCLTGVARTPLAPTDPSTTDAGFTVLELLIVLAITAMAVSVVAAGLVVRTDRPDTTVEEIQTFFSEAKASVMFDGRDAVILLTPVSASFGEKKLSWDPVKTGMSLAIDGKTNGGSLVVFADGTLSGSVEIVSGNKSIRVSGVVRSARDGT